MLEDPNPGTAATRGSTGRWITMAVIAALLLAMLVYLSRRDEALAAIQRLSLGVLATATGLQVLSQLVLNASMVMPLQACVRDVGFWEILLVRTGGTLVGSIVPVAGGVAVRLAYLRSRGITYLDFTWATLLSNVLALAAAAVVGAAATAVLWMMADRPPSSVLTATGGVLGMSVAALLGFEAIPWLTRQPWLRRWSWLVGMRGWLATPSLSAAVFGLSIARHTLNFVTFGLLAQALSQAPGVFIAGGLVYALTSPLRMVNITPANLGVIEWAVAFVGRTLAIDLTTGLLVALAFRGVGVVAQGVAVLIGSAWVAAEKRT